MQHKRAKSLFKAIEEHNMKLYLLRRKFLKACKNGNLQALKEIYAKYPENKRKELLDINRDYPNFENSPFLAAINSSQGLEISEWFATLPEINSKKLPKSICRKIANDKYLDVIKLLYAKGLLEIDSFNTLDEVSESYDINYQTLKSLCLPECQNLAKWYYDNCINVECKDQIIINLTKRSIISFDQKSNLTPQFIQNLYHGDFKSFLEHNYFKILHYTPLVKNIELYYYVLTRVQFNIAKRYINSLSEESMQRFIYAKFSNELIYIYELFTPEQKVILENNYSDIQWLNLYIKYKNQYNIDCTSYLIKYRNSHFGLDKEVALDADAEISNFLNKYEETIRLIKNQNPDKIISLSLIKKIINDSKYHPIFSSRNTSILPRELQEQILGYSNNLNLTNVVLKINQDIAKPDIPIITSHTLFPRKKKSPKSYPSKKDYMIDFYNNKSSNTESFLGVFGLEFFIKGFFVFSGATIGLISFNYLGFNIGYLLSISDGMTFKECFKIGKGIIKVLSTLLALGTCYIRYAIAKDSTEYVHQSGWKAMAKNILNTFLPIYWIEYQWAKKNLRGVKGDVSSVKCDIIETTKNGRSHYRAKVTEIIKSNQAVAV
ncbi:MAG: hypothetical protein J0G32_03085 [Alphaproteobacteria bacterium]|nr:hypothetical protein [Alphaproteobacteria bacterium]OJV16333.1 MAG: hypothetical protein BGO27_03705 [Alphaproteobacteria bacterium 33-17]